MHLKKIEKLKQMKKLLEPETRPTTTFTLPTNQPTCNILPTILSIILSGMNIHTPLDGITTEREREEMVVRSGGIAMRGREFETTLRENLALESRVWVFGEEKRRGESV